MSSIAILGSMWGDEAKAKIVDVLIEEFGAEVVVRFQGGPNAGHTIVYDGQTYVVHTIPSGILYPKVSLVIGSGCVLNFEELDKEIGILKKAGFDVIERLFILGGTILILPIHKLIDAAREEYYSDNGKIGTTRQGIGPANESRDSRFGVRFVDTFKGRDYLSSLIHKHVFELNGVLQVYGKAPIGEDAIQETIEYLLEKAEIFRRCLVNDDYIYQLIKGGKKLIFEGAQGPLLDRSFGTYPYVTSSSTIYGSILSNCGLGRAMAPERVVQVVKAYTTRVGSGPFPTKIKDEELADKIRVMGNEFGATTNRPRDVGWIDLVLLEEVTRLNGPTEIALTCVDTLCNIGEVQICNTYFGKGELPTPVLLDNLDLVRPGYVSIDLSDCFMEGVTCWGEIPPKIRQYISIIEDHLNVPVTIVSFGRSREKVVFKNR